MVRTFLIENESELTADTTVVYSGRSMRDPDDLTTIMVSGARGKLLAKEIRGARVVQIGEGRMPGRLPEGYQMRQFTKNDHSWSRGQQPDCNLLDSVMGTQQTTTMMILIGTVCRYLNMRVTFEWIASDDGTQADTLYNWSGIISPEQDAAMGSTAKGTQQ